MRVYCWRLSFILFTLIKLLVLINLLHILYLLYVLFILLKAAVIILIIFIKFKIYIILILSVINVCVFNHRAQFSVFNSGIRANSDVLFVTKISCSARACAARLRPVLNTFANSIAYTPLIYIVVYNNNLQTFAYMSTQ